MSDNSLDCRSASLRLVLTNHCDTWRILKPVWRLSSSFSAALGYGQVELEVYHCFSNCVELHECLVIGRVELFPGAFSMSKVGVLFVQLLLIWLFLSVTQVFLEQRDDVA